MLVALFLVVGCAGLYRKPAIDVSSVTMEEIPSVLIKNRDRLVTLKGSARIVVESPEFHQQIFSDIVIKRPDSIFIKLEAAFGIDVGWFFSDRQTYLLYLPFQNSYYTGAFDSLKIPQFPMLELSYTKLLDLLLGIEIPLALENGSLAVQSGKILMSGGLQDQNISYIIDPNQGIVTQTEVRDGDGVVILRQKFDRISRVGGVVLPKTVRLERPNKKQSFLVYYTQMEVNKQIKPKAFRMKIPKGAVKLKI